MSQPSSFTMQSGSSMRTSPPPMLEVTIQRLEEIVDQETLALRTRQTLKLLQGSGPNMTLATRMGKLKMKLAVNEAALRVHLEAVREVSSTIAEAMQNADSDGTYTRAISPTRRS
jgi:hypothetical protein